MLELLPVGSGKLDGTPDRDDYEEGDAGLHDWCTAVDDKVAGFAEAQRSMSTFKEHVQYMARLSDWTQENGNCHNSYLGSLQGIPPFRNSS